MTKKHPPKWPIKFLRWFCNPEFVEDIEGDLYQLFEKRTLEGKAAKARLFFDVLTLLRLGLARKIDGQFRMNYYGILKHFFISTVRGLRKEKSYVLINFIGLAISICVSLLIWQYVHNLEKADSYHTNSENKFRINYNQFQNGAPILESSLTTYGLGVETQESISGVKNMVRVRPIHSDEGLVISNEDETKSFLEFEAYYVEKSFLDFFSYPLAHGDIGTALSSPNNIVLTKETSVKFFANENAMGKTLHISSGNLTGDFIVTGVLDHFPADTHLDFDYLIPVDFMLDHYGVYTRDNGWQWENFYTYFELENELDTKGFIEQVDALVDERLGERLSEAGLSLKSSLQPLSSIFLDPIIDGDVSLKKGNRSNKLLFTAIAIIILLIAGVNYINLSSARAIRKKEQTGLRKAIGADNKHLIGMYIFESILFNVIASITALVLAANLLPTIGDRLGIGTQFNLIHNPELWIILLGQSTVLSIVTGIYPALLSIRLSKSRFSTTKSTIKTKGVIFRKSLIIFQLIVSLILLSGTWIVYHQLNYMKSRALGIKMDQLFVVKGPRKVLMEGREARLTKHRRLKETLMKHSNVHALTATSNVPGTGEIWYGGVRKLGDSRLSESNAEAILVDSEFTTTYDLEFIAGKPFDPEMRDLEAVIINQSTLGIIGLSDPEEALNHKLVLEDLDTLEIYGVVKDVHWNSLHEPLGPTVFGVNDYPAFLTFKISTSNLPKTLELIETTYKELYPGDPYVSFFLDDEFNMQYESEQKFGLLFGIFSSLATLISCMGLLAIVAYSLSQKVKEIGIRKVLGASGRQLFTLLSKEYTFLFSLACFFSIPILYIAAQKWLSDFAYRLPFSVDIFLAPTLFLGFITLTIVSVKVFGSMKVNPVDQLRDE